MLIKKFIIGPYCDKITCNNPRLASIFNNSEDVFALKFSIESVLSESEQEQKSPWWKRWLYSIKQEKYGLLDIDKRMIVPFKLKQQMGNKDEFGNPCQLYGVTKDGDIA